jgi:hypothetical protein
MLEDLIEILKDTTCWITSGNHTYIFNQDTGIYGGTTPREAIAAAIAEFKKNTQED